MIQMDKETEIIVGKLNPPILQYSLGKILLIWAAAAIPMGVLGWLVAPALAIGSDKPGIVRIAVLTVGLVWQFLLVMILLYRESGSFAWSSVRERLWLVTPRSPQTGKTNGRLWWWLILPFVLTAIFDLQIKGIVDRLWVSIIPFLAEPAGFSMTAFVATPALKAQFVGNWGVWILFLLNALFNTVLGEELLFRGLLLPRMSGLMGKWDWLVNGLIFGLYHLHQPWSMVSSMIDGVLFYAFPSRYFKSAWFGIIAHSGQSIFLALLILGLVLGLA